MPAARRWPSLGDGSSSAPSTALTPSIPKKLSSRLDRQVDWLEVGCFTAMRPGELDALSWRQLDFEAEVIEVDVQWNVKTASFTEPKYGPYTIALVDHAKQRLLKIPRDAAYVFTTLRGTHYTPSSRNHHWNRVRAAVGLGDMTLYLATRHYFGYYALNILDLEPSVIAVQFGHRDGGRLVEELYGHRDKRKSLAKIRKAFADASPSRPPRGGRYESS